MGQRIGDVLKMRWNDLDANEIKAMQGKTDKGLTNPLTDRLSAYLAAIRKSGLTIVTDANGGPAIYRTIAQEMRRVKATMQHPNTKTYVTHGLRKNATIELYQAGCRDELVSLSPGIPVPKC
jgi:integrase